MDQHSVAGVDWAAGEWVAVVFQSGSYSECALEDSFEALWGIVPDLDHVLIDVPIGLPENEETLSNREELDSLARMVTGRSSSVFPVPSRKACEGAYNGDSYEKVSETNRDEIGKRLSRQSYHISSGIAEIDSFLQANNSARETVAESHPEVCFRGFLGRQLQHSKQTAAGVGERLEALDGHLDAPETVFRDLCKEFIGKSSDVAVDDVVDALGLAVTAWKTREQSYTLPEDPQYDAADLPMQMVYWSDEPLD